MVPKGILLDYGGTLVEEISFDPRAGNQVLLELLEYIPPNLAIEPVMERASARSQGRLEQRLERGARNLQLRVKPILCYCFCSMA